MFRNAVAAVMALCTASGLRSQGTAKPQEFQVVSIKPNRGGNDDNSMRTSPGRFEAQNVTPENLLLYAFGVRESQLVGGPDWVARERFDITGVTGTSVDLNRTTLPPFLLSMFADRFHLKYHRENREFPVYSLVIAKGGPKLTAHTGEGQPLTGVHSNAGKTLVNARKTSMKRLAEVLSQQADRFVIDNTGLSGEYDFSLSWTSDLSNDSGDPSLVTAIQEQLGLRLESAKGPIQVVVIDGIERPAAD